MEKIYILWLRQLKRYFRSRSRMVGALGQPLLFLVALGFGFGPIYQRAAGGSYIQFLVPGIVAMSVLFTAMFSGIEIIWDRQFGFLKETLVAPISRMEIMIGRTSGGATVAIIQGMIVLLLSFLIGFRLANWTCLILVFLFMLLIALFFTALGTAIASKMEDMHGFQLIMNFLVMPLFFLSGALFPLENLPRALKVVVMLDPLSYGVDGLRGALETSYQFGFLQDFLLLGAATGILLVIGSYLFSKIEL
jgi:ABC-2 type transport system permease protein